MHRISCGLGGAGLGAIGAASTLRMRVRTPAFRASNKRRSTSQQYTDDLLIRGTRQMREPGLQRHGNYEATVTSALTLTPLVIANKRRAPVAVLSPTKRTAVIECFNNNGLHKGRGYWWGTPEGKHISGVTVADLARDGIFSVFINLRHGSARLTERGQWFARTLIEAANEAPVRK